MLYVELVSLFFFRCRFSVVSQKNNTLNPLARLISLRRRRGRRLVFYFHEIEMRVRVCRRGPFYKHISIAMLLFHSIV